MSFTHTQTRRVRTAGGYLARSITKTSSGTVEASVTVADGETDSPIFASVDPDSCQSFYLVSSEDVTVTTNDPNQSFDLVAGVPRLWDVDSAEEFFLTASVLVFYVTNASGADANIELRALHNVALGDTDVADLLAMLRSRGESLPVASFVPTQLAGLGLWLDPFDLESFTFAYAAEFIGDSHYLATADHADFDFAAAGKFSVEFWRNSNENQSNANQAQWAGVEGLDRCYAAQWNQDTSASWSISSGGSTLQGTRIRVLCATAADPDGSSATVSSTTDSSTPRDWSHCVVIFDMAGSPTVKVYLDGVLQTFAGGGTLPTAMLNSTATVALGLLGPTFWPGNHAQNRTRIYGNALTSGDVTLLYNAGLGHYHATNPATGEAGTLAEVALSFDDIRASWDLTEAEGVSRADSSGNGHTLAETGGTVTRAKLAMEWRDKSPNHFVFHPVSIKVGVNLAIPHFGAAMRYLSATIGSSPALRSIAGLHNLYCATPQPWDSATVDVLQTLRYAQIGGMESYSLTTADEGTATRYIMPGLNASGGDESQLRNRNDPTFNANWQSDNAFVEDTNYVNNWRLRDGLDSVGALNRLNGTVGSSIASGADHGYDEVLGRDNIGLACYVRSDGVSSGAPSADLYLGEQLVYDADISEANNQLAEEYLALWAAVALA